jgi:hypothetical protein
MPIEQNFVVEAELNVGNMFLQLSVVADSAAVNLSPRIHITTSESRRGEVRVRPGNHASAHAFDSTENANGGWIAPAAVAPSKS